MKQWLINLKQSALLKQNKELGKNGIQD